MIGIYKIENLVNNKVYIGQSVNIEERWYSHIHSLEQGHHCNKHLQNAWNKYGSKCFSFTILELCTEDRLTEREQYWIDYYGGINSNNSYNSRDAGNKGSLSIETKEKLREIGLGKPAWNKGLSLDDIRVQKYANALRNRTLSDEMKKRISETVRKRHQEGVYKYAESAKKGYETRRRNGTVRKDKGKKRGPRDADIGRKISEGKLKANQRKRELGLPLRNEIRQTLPPKISICTVCGREFTQKSWQHNKTCSVECKWEQIRITRQSKRENNK